MSSLEAIRAVTSATKPSFDHGSTIAEVVPGLYIAHSSQVATGDSLASLPTAVPVGLVVNAATEKTPDRPGFFGPGVDVLPIDVLDTPTADAKSHFREVGDQIEQQLSCGKGVVLHCHASVSRGPTFAIAYLMKHKGMTALEATSFLKKRWDQRQLRAAVARVREGAVRKRGGVNLRV